MKNFLRRVKIIIPIRTELTIQKEDFVTKLNENVDHGTTDLFSDMFDAFQSSTNDYKGEVNMEGFRIKRRKKFFDMNMNFAITSGTYSQQGEKLIIEGEINGFRSFFIIYYVFCIFIYSVFLVTYIASIVSGESIPSFTILFILIHATFMMGIPFIMMRKSCQKMSKEIEREFFFLTKKTT